MRDPEATAELVIDELDDLTAPITLEAGLTIEFSRRQPIPLAWR